MFGQRKIEERLETIERLLLFLGRREWNAPEFVGVVQIDGEGNSMAIKGVPAGGSGVFQAVNVPSGSVLPSGTVLNFSSSDPGVVLSASPDGDPTKIMATCAAGNTNSSFNLTVSATINGASITSGPVAVPILAATSGSGAPTSFTINQIS